MQLNEKQQLAVDKAAEWYAKQNTQIFKMAGYAGTGKTTVATTIARTLEADESRGLSGALHREPALLGGTD